MCVCVCVCVCGVCVCVVCVKGQKDHLYISLTYYTRQLQLRHTYIITYANGRATEVHS